MTSPGATADSSKRTKTNGADESVMASSFVSNYLASLNDSSVRNALMEIVTQGVAALQCEITELKAVNEAQSGEIESLKSDLAVVQHELSEMTLSYNHACQEIADLQQYTRRNALRISNPAWPETPDENTDNLVLQLASQLNVNLQPWEISRSHRVGKPYPGKIRPVLVKFIGYRSRERLFKARKLLKNHQTLKKVYINEDLTKTTNELAYKARQLKRSGAIAETFTSDCKVFVKKFAGSNIVLVKNEVELIDIASLSTFSQTLNRPMPGTVPPQAAGNLPAPAGVAPGMPVVSEPVIGATDSDPAARSASDLTAVSTSGQGNANDSAAESMEESAMESENSDTHVEAATLGNTNTDETDPKLS